MREFSLEAFFSRWQPHMRHQLTASESETMGFADLLHLADADDRCAWDHAKLGYTDPRGAAPLRQAIAQLYERVPADSVLSFAGAQEALYVAMHSLLSDSDHVIVVTPNYQSAESVPAALCDVSGIALDPARNWSLDIDALAAKIRPNTKVVSINFPNNPTGKILERDRFEALIALCRQHGIWLFSDEVYRLIERDPEKRLPAVVDCYERGISLGGMSKSFGLPGLRIGWLACRDPHAITAMRQVKNYLSICAATYSEILAQIALKASETILSRNRLIAEQNLSLVNRLFAAREDLFEWAVPDGGVIGFPRYHGAEGVDAFCERLIYDHGLLLMPSRIFHSELTPTPADHFRIGFGRCDFAQGLAVLANALTDKVTVKMRARRP